MSFDNAFEDYSFKSFRSIFNGDNQLRPDSAIRKESDTFWSKVNIIYKNINTNNNSVFTGTSGIALLMLRKSVTSPELLNDALTYLNLDKLKERHVSFLCGDAGPLAIGAILYYKLGNKSECAKLIERLIALNTDVLNPKSDLPNELLYGRVGYLYALLFINTHIEPVPVDDHLIREIISVILSAGKCEARHSKHRAPLMYQWHSKNYLGAAHGLSGIMYMLLQAAQYLSKYELAELIKPTVDYLTKQRYDSGNYMSSLGSHTDRLVQWCHGAPGFTHMYCKAYEVLKDEKYLKFALECGEIVWERGLLRKGYSICHGVAGNTYTFLQLYQTTQDMKHLYRAARFAEWCTDYNAEREGHRPDRPLSMFEGITGRIYLLEDMTDPMHAKFPGYTI